MKKIIWYAFVSIFIIIAVIGQFFAAKDWNFYVKPKNSDWQNGYNLIPNFKENVYASAFPLCFDEFVVPQKNEMQSFEKTSDLLTSLNKFDFNKKDINSNHYYIKSAQMIKKSKEQIEKDIEKKFKEKNNVLNSSDFANEANKYLLYSQFMEKFVFEEGFDKFAPSAFNKSSEKYKYFGIDGNAIYKNKDYSRILKNIDYLFYNSDKDFAVKILSKDKKEELILYLTDSNLSFDSLYKEVLVKKERFNFSYRTDRLEKLKHSYEKTLKNNVVVLTQTYLKIPFINIDEILNYNELEGITIKDQANKNDKIIKKALQVIKFNFEDNCRNTVKGEIAPSTGVNFKIVIRNKYYFNRPFVIFLKNVNSEKPYFAAKIFDTEYLIQE